jgi:hypothetical protein
MWYFGVTSEEEGKGAEEGEEAFILCFCIATMNDEYFLSKMKGRLIVISLL